MDRRHRAPPRRLNSPRGLSGARPLPRLKMVETCIHCGERAVVFVIANKWRCKKCGKYLDWTQVKGPKK